MNNASHGDTRFFTNEDDERLSERLCTVIGRETEAFDSLTGYFYITGYELLSKALSGTQKIRILIGMGSDEDTISQIIKAQQDKKEYQAVSGLNTHVTKDEYADKIKTEFSELDDTISSYHSTKKIIEDIKTGRVEVKAYPGQGLHAKLYIMHYEKSAMDKGRIVTGSSNFSIAGLTNNIELNVELKDSGDYQYASNYFNELWEQSVSVDDILINTVENETWFNDEITPYELFLKFLYEHFSEEINAKDNFDSTFVPDGFMELEYQKQAVLASKRILKEYNGVFISDVVGLGKTYMGALLAQQIQSEGRILVIAPPHLIHESNHGGWRRVFEKFAIPAQYCSIGALENIIKRGDTYQYSTVFIDESHRFRNDNGQQWADLKTICKDKKVVLLSATPYNNSPSDILSQISLFQQRRNSNIPGLLDLESFFTSQQKRIEIINRKTNPVEYIETSKDVAREIRNKVLKYVMIRRTRSEIERYFQKDMVSHNLSFPKAHPPQPIYYELNTDENALFHETLGILKEFNYARYTPKLYLKDEHKSDKNIELLSQKNLKTILKGLLLKRMDSSIPAFVGMLGNMYKSTQYFYDGINAGNIYYAGKKMHKLYDALEEGDDIAIAKILEHPEVTKEPVEHYKDALKTDVEEDLFTLKELLVKWETLFSIRDIKKNTLVTTLTNDKRLQDKVIIFTESAKTAEYLTKELLVVGRNPLMGIGSGDSGVRQKIIDNFSPVKDGKSFTDDYDVLIVTDAYSEGINLHSTNVIINYDIPWNPTRMMQRAGRINRIGTVYKDIYIYNFFPVEEVNQEIALESKAMAKIEAFFELLGEDAGVLTEGERPEAKGIFNASTLEDDEDGIKDSELRYLEIIRNIRDTDEKLFSKIKRLAIKSRSAKDAPDGILSDSVLSYIRKGNLKKYFISKSDVAQEIDFMETAELMESEVFTPLYKMSDIDMETLYSGQENNIDTLYAQNKIVENTDSKGIRGNSKIVSDWLKVYIKNETATGYDKEYFKSIKTAIDVGEIPKGYIQVLSKQIKLWQTDKINPPVSDFRQLLEQTIPNALLNGNEKKQTNDKQEIVVTLFMKS